MIKIILECRRCESEYTVNVDLGKSSILCSIRGSKKRIEEVSGYEIVEGADGGKLYLLCSNCKGKLDAIEGDQKLREFLGREG